MPLSPSRFILLLFGVLISPALLTAQAGPSGPPRRGSSAAPDGSSQSASGTGLAGLAYPPATWSTTITFKKNTRVIWYKVQSVDSSVSQPLILEPISCADQGNGADSEAFKGCHDRDSTHFPSIPDNNRNPLKDTQKLVIAIYDSQGEIQSKGVYLLVLNVTAQTASPLTPAPVRASLSPSSGAGAGPGGPAPSARTYYLTWPNRLVGDTAVTVTVSAILPAPAGSSDNPNPSEPNINLLNFTYSQVHALNSYNVAFGVIRSTNRNPTFVRSETAAAVNCPTGSAPTCVASPEMYTTQTIAGSPAVDPAVFFTVYALGRFDAERKWWWHDLKPEPSVGLSLSSPTTDFFFGASVELLRGVQFVNGWHYGKINSLVSPLVNDPTSSAAPQTTLKTKNGYFLGITFNINFIQSLFGGGGGK